MEKSTPHCKLTVVKALVEAGKVRATNSARLGATALGLDLPDMLAVYRPSTQAGDVYLKLTVIDDVLIVSFKEL